jgi:hypothetical protein
VGERRFATGASGFWRAHVHALLAAAGEPAAGRDALVEVLLAPLAPTPAKDSIASPGILSRRSAGYPRAFGQRMPRFEVVRAVRLLGHVAVPVLDLGFQLDRVDGSHAGTPSRLKFCWVDAGRSARAMSGIDGRAGQGPANAGDPGPRGS